MHETRKSDDGLSGWIGRSETDEDSIGATPAMALAATLDRNDPSLFVGDELPPLAHWLCFLPLRRQSELGPDGHPMRGDFLPPVALPRRMWAGSRIEFHRPIHVGDHATRHSRVLDVEQKQGRSGALVFVTVRHEISVAGELAVAEQQDIVYREHAAGGDAQRPAAPVAPAHAEWTRELQVDETMLFRYSALTFNGHRIHYDRRYATGVESYPGLVVHGPLLATLLVDHLRRAQPDARLASFEFRALATVFDNTPFQLCGAIEDGGKSVRLWIQNSEGALCMNARAAIR